MISREICLRVLQAAASTGADYAEMFAENTVHHSIGMVASKVDNIKDTVIAGAAVRVYKGLRSVMASTVDTSEAGLIACAQKAADALGEGTAQIDIVLKERLFGDIHPVKIVPSSVHPGPSDPYPHGYLCSGRQRRPRPDRLLRAPQTDGPGDIY